MKRIIKCLILTCMIISMGVMTAFAGNTNYNNYNIQYTSYTFNSIDSGTNTKATVNAPWFMTVYDITFNRSTSDTLGMAFTPLYHASQVGAEVAWYLSEDNNVAYYTWNSKGSLRTYTLGVRLDTLLTTCTAGARGIWNSN